MTLIKKGTGLITILLALFVFYRSFTIGLSVFYQNVVDYNGLIGVVFSFAILIAGIITVSNSTQTNTLASSILCLAGILAILFTTYFTDLIVWGGLSILLAAILILLDIISLLKINQKKRRKK
ncbi:hypothetical protein CBF34_01350 [Vagococcus penaei]|uniref:Uncharacterized protein n=1 Tax=Vagococcus penaei TaxID=633807 RepID=A0A1Q2D8A8_9ENTE|nr:hypothetical protein [Vagococcus penaei]AQP54535.1 hypothetical protein BW732_10185 [Vagococcus penaei]RSU06757.1 hypothetical protein CBF34_01350 [Vagococcus penaei]